MKKIEPLYLKLFNLFKYDKKNYLAVYSITIY